MIIAYWAGFVCLIFMSIFVFGPKFSMPDKVFFNLFYIYVGCFPAMLACILALWKKSPRYARICLGFSVSLGIISFLSIPTVTS